MKIVDVMTNNPEFVTPQDSLLEVAQIMAQRDCGVVPICESVDTRKLVGCITDRDIVVRVIAEHLALNVPLNDIMSINLVTCHPEDDVEHARELMEQHQIRRLMVVDDYGSLMGVVATADLALAVEEREVGETVEAISQPAPTLNTK